jgi:hypothetical protein
MLVLGPCGLKGPRGTQRLFFIPLRARAERWAKITTAGLERLVSPDPTEALALFDEVQPS